MKEVFPDVEIIGNYEVPKIFGIFQVYMQGVGPLHQQDNQGRIFFHDNSSKTSKKFPLAKEIFDNVVHFVIAYGNCGKMGKAQDKYLEKYKKVLAVAGPDAHGHPAEDPMDGDF